MTRKKNLSRPNANHAFFTRFGLGEKYNVVWQYQID